MSSVGEVVEMVGGDGSDLRRQGGTTRVAELIGMKASSQAVPGGRRQDAAGFVDGEGAVVAEHVAERRQGCGGRKHLVDDQANVRFPVVPILGGDDMGPEKGGHDIDRNVLAD